MAEFTAEIPHMVSIREAAKLTGLSYDYIRKLCINDQIVYVRAGNKYIVNMGKLIDFLNVGIKQQPAERVTCE